MELTHTSPEQITEINDAGLFGEFLCFSADEYVMTEVKDYFTYTIDVDVDALIEAESLFYHEDSEKLYYMVEGVAEEMGCDTETAEELISGRESVFDIESDIAPEDMAEAAWRMQYFAAKAAKTLGYRGVIVDDEQGACYMIDMLHREYEMQEESASC